jgi:uncharacterized membrane protein
MARIGLIARWSALAITAFLVVAPAFGVIGSVTTILFPVLGIAFMAAHGVDALGARSLGAFILITAVVSFSSEAAGVATGLVFGDYHYSDQLGPKLLGVPPVVQLAYISMGYASLSVARVVLGNTGSPRGLRLLALPLAGTFVMVAWDMALDPYSSTVSGDWVWEEGGEYFGVPIHNYIGWFCTVLLIFTLYEAYSACIAAPKPRANAMSRAFWSEPIVYYAIFAAIYITAPVIPGALPESIDFPQNYAGSLEALSISVALIAVFAMGPYVVFAVLRLLTGSSLPLSRDL